MWSFTNVALREGCSKEGAKNETHSVSIKSREHTEQMAFRETSIDPVMKQLSSVAHLRDYSFLITSFKKT